jgi:ribose-phosphate pyrophosphokinase
MWRGGKEKMIKLNGEVVDINYFPDGTLLLKEEKAWCGGGAHNIVWYFENNEELVTLIFLTKHLRSYDNTRKINLYLPYIPNARQDRVKTTEDVFTLKYFADIINYLNFNQVRVLDPHSSVSEALINNIIINRPDGYILKAIKQLGNNHPGATKEDWMLFYPDEGAMKRYSTSLPYKYAFGIKKRDWATGKIEGLDVAGCVDDIKDKIILIVDDICSRGGTFYHSAKKLKELGAKEVYLYVTHCENTILEGDLLTSGLIEKVYTTNSIFTKKHEKIEVFKL